MKAGKNIRRTYLVLSLIIMIFYSCDEIKKEEIDSIVYSYIDDFKKNKKIKKRDFLLHINKDSTIDDNLEVYRINMWPNLLDSSRVPNKIFIYKGIKVAFFTKSVEDRRLRHKIKTELKEKGFYGEDKANILSNYPEWVIIKKGMKQLIVKDMWYSPLDSIIKKYKKEIE